MFLAGAAIGGPKSCNKCEHTNDFFYGVSDLEIVSRYVFIDTRGKPNAVFLCSAIL
jgi:hypothetical protein